MRSPTSISSLTGAVTAAFVFLISPAFAAEEVDPSAKLREQLRTVMLQVRTAQTEASNAAVAKAAAEQKVAEMTTKIADLEKRSATLAEQSNKEQASAAEDRAKMTEKIEARDKVIGQYKEALEKWKSGYQKAAEIARTKEQDRSALAGELLVSKRTIADRERKNISLFNTSLEILDRYEGYSLGKALSAREPFIGLTRVKVENLVQGYKDTILDNRIDAAPAKR